jgi:hypothetical protein
MRILKWKGLKRLGLNVMWVGKPSMRWSSIVPVVQSMINCFGLPKAVICHCGGNEIGCMSPSCEQRAS